MTRAPDPSRRALFTRALALGIVSVLPGCDYDNLQNPDLPDRFLRLMSSWNDRVQTALFSGSTLAHTFAPAQITRSPRFNAFHSIDYAPEVDPGSFKLALNGRITETAPWTLFQLRNRPQYSQITRLICIEGWCVVGQWSGPKLSDFLARIGVDEGAR